MFATNGNVPPYSTILHGDFGPEGVNRREVKKREEKRSTPAFFSFFASRPQLWGSQGRVAPEAGLPRFRK